MKRKHIIFSSAASFLISSISAALITAIRRETAPLLSNSLAVVFWLSILAGFTFCGVLAKKTRPKEKTIPRPLCFFQTTPLKMIDAIFIVSLIGTVLCSVLDPEIALLWVSFLFFDILSIEMHVLFNVINKEDFSK